jgi:hypothetical protein
MKILFFKKAFQNILQFSVTKKKFFEGKKVKISSFQKKIERWFEIFIFLKMTHSWDEGKKP